MRFPDFARRIQGEQIRSERQNALRTSDIRLQRADPAYATRAGANNAHFLLARPNTKTDVDDYAALTIGAGTELNAIGVYSFFHLSALQKATRLANESFTPEQRAALVRAMLADEALASAAASPPARAPTAWSMGWISAFGSASAWKA